MRAKIALIFAILVVGCVVTIADSGPDHLSEAKKKFPYSLIGDDFGILTADDLAIPTCRVFPEPYHEVHGKDGNSFAYWKCFPTTNVQVDCSGGSYDHGEHEILTVMGIIIKDSSEINEYMTRRAVPLSSCKSWQQDWKRLSQNQSHVCFSGSPLSKESVLEGGRSVLSYGWIFESFKTKRGCSSYFVGGCSLSYQIKHGCKVRGAIR